ncbi:hypothetical protein LguiB_003883 [Lonicera macranthoides]
MMGAKSLLMRPHLLAFCACPPSVYFLSSRYLSIPQRLSSLKTGVQHPPIKSDAIFNRSLSVRATTHQVNNSGSIDSPLMQSMQKKIKEHLNAESVTVVDANGDGRHVRKLVTGLAILGGGLGGKSKVLVNDEETEVKWKSYIEHKWDENTGIIGDPNACGARLRPTSGWGHSTCSDIQVLRHVQNAFIDVISSAFEGQSAVNRQRMVYKAIWEELQNTVHAVDQMTTRTPSEAA